MPLVWTLLLNGLLGLAGYWVARHALRIPAGLPRGLAAATLAWAWATLGMEVLGIAGLLTYDALLAWTTAGLLIAGVFWWRDRGMRPAGETPQPGPDMTKDQPWEISAIVALGLVLWAFTVHALNSVLGPVKVVSDGPIYHLYFAARWWKAGRLFVVAAPFGESVVSYFPAVGDLWFTWLLAGWGGERLAKVGQLPFFLVAALAAFAERPAARRRGLGGGHCHDLVRGGFSLSPVHPRGERRHDLRRGLPRGGLLLPALRPGRPAQASLILGALAIGGVLGDKADGDRLRRLAPWRLRRWPSGCVAPHYGRHSGT